MAQRTSPPVSPTSIPATNASTLHGMPLAPPPHTRTWCHRKAVPCTVKQMAWPPPHTRTWCHRKAVPRTVKQMAWPPPPSTPAGSTRNSRIRRLQGRKRDLDPAPARRIERSGSGACKEEKEIWIRCLQVGKRDLDPAPASRKERSGSMHKEIWTQETWIRCLQ